MNKEVRLAILEEGKKNVKKSDKKKRYREKNRLIREEKKQEREAFKKEKSEVIKSHTVSGVAPQAERPPQLNQIIDKMMKNNALFEKEKAQPKVDHKKAMAICRRNMKRFDSIVSKKRNYNNGISLCWTGITIGASAGWFPPTKIKLPCMAFSTGSALTACCG